MRKSIRVARTLAAPAAKVWDLITSGDRVERWFEWVAETRVRDANEGGLRVIAMKDGSSFEEYITLNDARTRTYQYYAANPPLPILHVIGSKRISTSASGEATLSWLITFDLLPHAPANFVEQMTRVYSDALTRIDELSLEPGSPS